MSGTFWLFGIFALASLVIGLYSIGGSKTFSAYALSKGSFSTFTLISTVSASFIGGGCIVGTAEKTFQQGLVPVYGVIGFILQLLFTGILFAGPITNTAKWYITAGELFGRHYGLWAKKVVGLSWICMGTGVVAANVYVMGQVIASAFSLGNTFAILIGGTILLGYSVLGGIRAVVFTDVMQFLVMAIAIPLICIYLTSKVGVADFLEMLKASAILPAGKVSAYSKIISVFIGFLLGDALIPPVLQRLMMCTSKQQITKMMFISSFLALILVSCAAFMGILVKGLSGGSEGDFLSLLVIQIPGYLKPVCHLALFATAISTADSYLNSLSVVCANEVFELNNDYKKLKVAQISTLFIGIVAALLGIFVPNAQDILLFSFKFWGPIVLVPMVGLLMSRPIKILKHQLVIMFSFSIAIILFWNLFDMQEKTGVSDLVPGILSSLILYTFFYSSCRQRIV